MNEVIELAPGLSLDMRDVHMDAVRASGAGGQNVNKVSSAIHLRYDLHHARLPERVRRRLLASGDSRISGEGILVIKAQRHRTQAKNRADALLRLQEVLLKANHEKKARRATKPSVSSQRRRLDKKQKHSKNKVLRKKPNLDS
ncbi:MAG: alternative ribosome rescue aminoacyl-tRNA hydrolase ArfB [Pseudomonadota bacterium]